MNGENKKFISPESVEKEITSKQVSEIIFSRINGLIKKYSEQGLQGELDQDYDSLYKKCLIEFQGKERLVEVLFGTKNFIEAEEKLHSKRSPRLDRAEIKEIFLNLTEWQSRLTELFLTEGDDKKFCKSFWRQLENFYKLFSSHQSVKEREQAARKIRRGIVGQVGVYRMLEALGFSPQLASPEEDAFEKTDLWCDLGPEKKLPIQVKYTGRVGELLIMKSDEVSYPSIMIKGKSMQIASKDIQEMARLKEKNKEGIYIALPRGAVDSETGRVHEWFLDEYGPEIKKYFK